MWRQVANFEDIRYERTEDGIAKITINRPEVRNAFRPETVAELLKAFELAHEDPEVGVVILTGEGPDAFCSGGDQKVRGNAGYVGGDGVPRLNILDVQRKIRTLPKPVIAMVAGYAIGGGHVLHVVCDLTIAAENARFGQTGPKVGSFDGGLGSSYLARIVGQKKAREIWYLCRQYDAKQALEMGLVNAVVPLERLEEETLAWAREILQHSPLALRCLKAALNADCDGQMGLLDLAGNATLLYYMSEEAKEGKNAFLEEKEAGLRQIPPSPVNAWLLALRPKTLPAAVVPVWMGNLPLLAASHREGQPFSWLLFWATLLSCVCIQIATNLFNDAIDARKGADTDLRLGPRRVTATGMLSPGAVVASAVFFCMVAALIAAPLIVSRGPAIVAIGTVSLLLAYGYTGGPYPLSYNGLGELFVVLFFGLVAVGGSYFAQSGLLPGAGVWIVAVQVGCYSSVLIAVNNLRDRREDGESGKRTLAVRFGERFARWEIALFCLGPAVLGLAGALWGDWRLALPALFLLPLSLRLVLGVFRTEPSRKMNRYLGLGALQLVVFAGVSTVLWL